MAPSIRIFVSTLYLVVWIENHQHSIGSPIVITENVTHLYIVSSSEDSITAVAFPGPQGNPIALREVYALCYVTFTRKESIVRLVSPVHCCIQRAEYNDSNAVNHTSVDFCGCQPVIELFTSARQRSQHVYTGVREIVVVTRSTRSVARLLRAKRI